jgi:hypothetical protein
MIYKDVKMSNGEVMTFDNMSPDGKVGFLDKDHVYINIDRPTQPYSKSVTGLIGLYYDKFDPIEQAKRVVKNKRNLTYYGRDWKEVMEEWVALGKEAADMGTQLHAYGEALLNNDTSITPPDSPKAQYVPIIVHELLKEQEYELAKTELLVYSDLLDLAGQSDIILKKGYINEDSLENKNLIKRKFPPITEYDYMIYDWKFLSKPLEKKAFYSHKKRSFKMMKGPFKYLHDCNWIHYSIQLAIYQTLTGMPKKIKEKVLIVVNDDGYEYVPAYPMRVYWDTNHKLQAVYETYYGKWYMSEYGKMFNEKPEGLEGV